MTSAVNTGRSWGDWMIEMDEDRSRPFVMMTNAEWKECSKGVITHRRGKGDLRPVMEWIKGIEAIRSQRAQTAHLSATPDASPNSVMFRIWRDMILEPAKYAEEDWEEWLVMDHQLTTGPKRWRVAAFWQEMDDLAIPQREAAFATRIQAIWRGHRARGVQVGLDCSNCLAHTPSPKRWTGAHVCLQCWNDTVASQANVVQRVQWHPEPTEDGLVPCEGCGDVCCHADDHGEYRPGHWCSRECAYDL